MTAKKAPATYVYGTCPELDDKLCDEGPCPGVYGSCQACCEDRARAKGMNVVPPTSVGSPTAKASGKKTELEGAPQWKGTQSPPETPLPEAHFRPVSDAERAAMMSTPDDILKELTYRRGKRIPEAAFRAMEAAKTEVSDGSSANYYTLPEGATQLQELISCRDMNAQMGEIFRACYRYGKVAHSPKMRDIKKIIFYAQAELERLEKYENG